MTSFAKNLNFSYCWKKLADIQNFTSISLCEPIVFQQQKWLRRWNTQSQAHGSRKTPHIRSYIETFISSSSSERPKKFLVNSTGGYYLPNKKIKVVAFRRNNFFNSTCSFKIECPQFGSYKEFETAFVGVINPEGKKFNVV